VSSSSSGNSQVDKEEIVEANNEPAEEQFVKKVNPLTSQVSDLLPQASNYQRDGGYLEDIEMNGDDNNVRSDLSQKNYESGDESVSIQTLQN